MNIFLTSNALVHETGIDDLRTLPDGRIAIAVAENIFRPAGGGQPRDYGLVELRSGNAVVSSVWKEEGLTWLTLDSELAGAPVAGERAVLHVDRGRRQALSRSHSLVHLFMAAAKEMAPGYESKGADIADDAASSELRFKSRVPLDLDCLRAIDRHARSILLSDRAIVAERVKSLAHAEAMFPYWRVDPDLALSGRIRVIHIADVDSNPCSGSHVASTAKIGPYALVGHRVDGVGNNVVTLRIQDAWSYWY